MSKIINKIDSFLLEKDQAKEVAMEIHKQKKGKEDDIPPKVIESALKKKMGDEGLKHFGEVKAWLKKKGYKIWVKKTLKSPFMKEQTDMYVCTECGYEKEGSGDCPNGHGKLKPAAETGGKRPSARDKEMDSLKETIKEADVSRMVSVRTKGQGRRGISDKLKEQTDLPLKPGKLAGWIAMYKGKKVEIKKSEAKGIYQAKQLAAKKLGVPKKQEHKIAIAPAQD